MEQHLCCHAADDLRSHSGRGLRISFVIGKKQSRLSGRLQAMPFFSDLPHAAASAKDQLKRFRRKTNHERFEGPVDGEEQSKGDGFAKGQGLSMSLCLRDASAVEEARHRTQFVMLKLCVCPFAIRIIMGIL